MTRLLMFVFVAFLLGGCGGSGGIKMDQQSINEIQKGVTTRAQVEAKIGAPTGGVGLMPDGRRTARYMYYSAHNDGMSYVPYANFFAGGVVSRRQNLQIIYRNNIVEDYEFSDTSGHSAGGFINPHSAAGPTASQQ